MKINSAVSENEVAAVISLALSDYLKRRAETIQETDSERPSKGSRWKIFGRIKQLQSHRLKGEK